MPVRKYQEFIPHSTLQDSVKGFWVLEKEYTTADPIEEVTPDACVELILNFGRPYSGIAGSVQCELPQICLVGLLSKPLKLEAKGVVKIVAVRFFAWGGPCFSQESCCQERPDATQSSSYVDTASSEGCCDGSRGRISKGGRRD
jgi:hypothetical protein